MRKIDLDLDVIDRSHCGNSNTNCQMHIDWEICNSSFKCKALVFFGWSTSCNLQLNGPRCVLCERTFAWNINRVKQQFIQRWKNEFYAKIRRSCVKMREKKTHTCAMIKMEWNRWDRQKINGKISIVLSRSEIGWLIDWKLRIEVPIFSICRVTFRSHIWSGCFFGGLSRWFNSESWRLSLLLLLVLIWTFCSSFEVLLTRHALTRAAPTPTNNNHNDKV